MSVTLATKAKAIFYQTIAWGVIFFTGLIFLGLKTYPQFIIIKQNITSQLETVCGCTNPTIWSSHPLRSAGIMLVGLFLFIFFTVVVSQLFRFIKSTTQFIRQNLKNSSAHLSPKLEKAVRIVGLDTRVREVISNQPLVFCYGFFAPRICISSALVERLADKELLAVLSHEQHHVITHEPIKMLLVKLLSRSFWFIPWFTLLAKKYFTYAELAADEHATRQLRDKASLARALDTIISWGSMNTTPDSLALSWFETVTEERINKLADDRYLPRFTIFTFRSVASSLALGFLVFLARPLFTNSQIITIDGAPGSCARAVSHTVVTAQKQCVMHTIPAIESEQKLYPMDVGARLKNYLVTVDN